VRFAIEGKSYALLLLMVALAWWCRRSQRPLLYALVSALAGITHFMVCSWCLLPPSGMA
jgi:hypothetical protein